MSPEEVLKYYGSKYRFGKETGISPPSLHNWLRWGYIPENQQCKIEVITKGALKAELTPIYRKPIKNGE